MGLHVNFANLKSVSRNPSLQRLCRWSSNHAQSMPSHRPQAAVTFKLQRPCFLHIIVVCIRRNMNSQDSEVSSDDQAGELWQHLWQDLCLQRQAPITQRELVDCTCRHHKVTRQLTHGEQWSQTPEPISPKVLMIMRVFEPGPTGRLEC